MSGEPLIAVKDLNVGYWSETGWHDIVRGFSFALAPGEIVGLAGESGCGKSTIANALLAESRSGSRITQGSVVFDGRDILKLSSAELRSIRGGRISVVPQNPTTSLTPSMSCGRQVREVLESHGIARGRAAIDCVLEIFAAVGLPAPRSLYDRYPHELSGGQQQRVVIGMAIACQPALILLDEPTTGLDVTTQARILHLLADLRTRFGTALLYVSHDLGALAEICDRIAIMYAGTLVEEAPTAELFANPQHPYTRGLLASMPRLDRPPPETPPLEGVFRRVASLDGCRFASRCKWAADICLRGNIPLEHAAAGHEVACLRRAEIARSA